MSSNVQLWTSTTSNLYQSLYSTKNTPALKNIGVISGNTNPWPNISSHGCALCDFTYQENCTWEHTLQPLHTETRETSWREDVSRGGNHIPSTTYCPKTIFISEIYHWYNKYTRKKTLLSNDINPLCGTLREPYTTTMTYQDQESTTSSIIIILNPIIPHNSCIYYDRIELLASCLQWSKMMEIRSRFTVAIFSQGFQEP